MSDALRLGAVSGFSPGAASLRPQLEQHIPGRLRHGPPLTFPDNEWCVGRRPYRCRPVRLRSRAISGRARVVPAPCHREEKGFSGKDSPWCRQGLYRQGSGGAGSRPGRWSRSAHGWLSHSDLGRPGPISDGVACGLFFRYGLRSSNRRTTFSTPAARRASCAAISACSGVTRPIR